ncbi:type II toxin-antitoxin system RelE/ParE family toxin [Piscinibacter sp.]|uniref:type II toxin-antitoxin system RelE/ParE family toxin n=1 Tax=Piscinibacter sp. TaxID=1903157 RepID=UPI0039E6399B
MIFSIHPLAEAELVDGASFYAKEANAVLGEAFIAEFHHAVELLREHPKLGARWRGPLRRLPMRRFPYSIVYHESLAALRIIAIAHQSRRPGYWRGRS